MPQPSVLYDTLLNLLKQAPWRDRRHLSTLAWMVAGLLSSGWIALDEWTPYVTGRATFAQSTVRRFSRWLSNPRIDVLRLHVIGGENLRISGEEPADGWCRRKKGLRNAGPLSFALETTGFRIQNGGSPPPRMESSTAGSACRCSRMMSWSGSW